MQEQNGPDYTKVMLLFLVLILCIGMVFRIQLGIEMNEKLGRMEQQLASKDELNVDALPSAFGVLDETCTDCHSERRYGGLDLSSEDVDALVARMNRHPDLDIAPDQWRKIHAALVLQRCLVCHEESSIKTFLAMPALKRGGLVDHMIHSSGSNITRSDAEEVLDAALVLAAN